jgi:hypothetical protein
MKDRSLSKSGLDKSLRKGGAGPHNWGSLEEQTHPYIHHNLDTAKLPPQNQDFKGDDVDFDNDDEAQEDQLAASPSTAAALHANAPGGAEQDKTPEVPNGGMQRRMSNMTEEEKEKARAWRHGALSRDSVDLAAIARTSGAFSQSPPNADSMLSTSPVMNMGAMAGKLNKY